MNHLFTPGGLATVARLRREPALLAFDFDGTLCALESEPDASRTLPINLPLLKALSRRYPVAIISGRSRRDLRPRLGFNPKYVVGNHGLEGLDPAAARASVATVRAWRKQLAARTDVFGDDPGVFVEDKVFSLSLHYRLGRDPARAARRLRAVIAGLSPAPRVIGGKFIFNLTLARTAHKGTALVDVMKREGVRRALFVGDDVTDEYAFAVKRAGILKVRVGSSRRSAADWYVKDLAGVTRLLESLL